MNENTIIVAGLESQLCAYDLRSISKQPAAPGEVTKPALKLPDYQNVKTEHLEAGFDVHGDYAAAATDDGHVRIWDVKDGKVKGRQVWENATCLRFVKREENGGVLSLIGTAGHSIVESAWRE